MTMATTALLAPPAQADLPDWVVIDNGTVQLGVNNVGDLNVPANLPSAGGTYDVGLRLLSTNSEATAPGCLCEGWGLADATTQVSGHANEADGRSSNLTVESFTATASTAVTTVRIGDTFEITHDYHPSSATPNLYEVTVTVKNISGATVAPRYRRVMDWDVEPTAFDEYSTIQGTAGAANVLFASDDGFASADPLSAETSINFTGDAIDDGPADHGALFDFGFPDLAAGDTFSFKTFYGGATTEAAAKAAIGAVGAEVYSFGQPNTADGPTLGTPNTFIFAFAGVGGQPQVPQVSLGKATFSVNEGAGSLSVPVVLNTQATSPVTVTLKTADGSAAAPGDYTAVDTVATIAAGQSSTNVSIPIVDDTADEPDETFSVALSNPSAAVLGDPGSATVTIVDNDEATPVNHAPVAKDQSVTTPQDTAKAITLEATDADNDALTYAIVSGPAHGTLSGTGASRTYTPAAGYSGPDSFTFRANDGQVNSNTATVSITVTPTAPSGHPEVDLVVSADRKHRGGAIKSPRFSTSGGGELLLAYISADGPLKGTQTVRWVKGAKLTWTLVVRANATGGTTEVWQAYAPSKLDHVAVHAGFRKGGYDSTITVAAYTGASTSVGSAAATGTSGNPSVTITPSGAGSLIWSAGHDWTWNTAPTVSDGGAFVHVFDDKWVHDYYWVQKQLDPTTGTSPVTVVNGGITEHRWQLVAVEIKPAT